MRCNQRFEAMLGLPPGIAAGRTLHELFAAQPQVLDAAERGLKTLAEGEVLETEFEFTPPGQAPLWYGLSVRRTDAPPARWN
ncbi:hypothetical protein FSC37_04535 [Piscinibacter aquaticus]|uniref:PAS fold-4 domain-containing protein n=1 Tax=Piscinibacter aquaticus TaxID=392597 RepID=A0A5C6TY95_9BURK|nr:hypothetical protein FSC37_04535 [Piscinibacter aquaticus]